MIPSFGQMISLFILPLIFIEIALIGKVLCDSSHENVQITNLKVPSFAKRGDDAELHCHYDSSEKMYSIKWYRNDKEFFYFIPSLSPPKRSIPLPGVNVSLENSNGKKMILQNVNLDTEGRFKCEVSTEWPHYYTADKSDFMSIVVLPNSKPDISGVDDHYKLGHKVQLTCTSAPTKPKSSLSWFINDIEVPPAMIIETQMRPSEEEVRLQVSSSTLRFVVEKSHFLRGRLTLRCSSVISSVVYHETRDHAVFEEVAFNVPLLDFEDKAALAGLSSNPDEGSSISGAMNPPCLELLSISTSFILSLIISNCWLIT